MPPLKASIEDRTIVLPRDVDVKADLRQIQTVRGIPKVPDDARTQGSDGGQRHGDAAVAICLAHAAAKGDHIEYGYEAGDEIDNPLGGLGFFDQASEGRALW